MIVSRNLDNTYRAFGADFPTESMACAFAKQHAVRIVPPEEQRENIESVYKAIRWVIRLIYSLLYNDPIPQGLLEPEDRTS